MKPVDQPAHNREMAARDAVKRVPEIARNHCPASVKYAFVTVRPNSVRLLKSKAAEREVPLHGEIERYLGVTPLPSRGRLFPTLSVDRVVKAYARLRVVYPALHGTVFHSTRKWFVTQCERTGTLEHFTASLVGHQSARSANRLTYGLYSGGISDAQKRDIIDRIRLPEGGQT